MMDSVTAPPVRTWTAAKAALPKRDLWGAMVRGWRGRCPNCGEGKLFCAFLKTAESCSQCGQSFTHHRADDLPAYLVIVIVGHIVVPLVLAVETNFAPSYWIHLAMWLPLTLGLSLGLLQPVKGTVVALQWYLGMHGFERARAARVLTQR
jgi:uncharacterized protein (DUF983 family)